MLPVTDARRLGKAGLPALPLLCQVSAGTSLPAKLWLQISIIRGSLFGLLMYAMQSLVRAQERVCLNSRITQSSCCVGVSG